MLFHVKIKKLEGLRLQFIGELNGKGSDTLLKIEEIDRENYIHFIEQHPLCNFLQIPSWADLKAEWQWLNELVAWIDTDRRMVGAASILYRKVPGLNKYLAYIPRGPLIDWFGEYKVKDWFFPLFHHLKQRKVFTVKMDPPIVARTWESANLKETIHNFREHGLKNKKLTDIRPDQVMNHVEFIQQELAAMGWRRNVSEDSFDTVQPQFIYRLNMQGKTLKDIFANFDPVWQQRIYAAEEMGIKIELGTEEDLPEFYHLMVQQAKREQTEPREINYFIKMFESLIFEDPHRIRLYMAKLDNELLSAALAIRVPGHTWDIYGAKKSDHFDDPASYLLRWKMIQDAYGLDDETFDFRGISVKLDASDPMYELLRFKNGFGGFACELFGEWDYPVIPMLHWAFDMYMKKR